MSEKLNDRLIHVSVFTEGDDCWPDLKTRFDQIIPAYVTSVCRLPKGMVSGKSSVAIRVDLPDGRVVIAQTSLAILAGVNAIFAGAEQRQAEAPVVDGFPAACHPTKH